MNEKIDKKIEELVNKTMKHSTLENPSLDFTVHVMSHVDAMSQSKATTYQPLISKKVWMLLLGGVIAFAAYVLFFDQTQSAGWFSPIDFSFLNGNEISKALGDFQFYKTTTYAVVLLAIMLLIQIPILKNYFNKRAAF